MWITFLSPSVAVAAALFSEASLPLKKEWQEPAPASLNLLKEARYELRSRYTAFTPSDRVNPKVTSETQQSLVWRNAVNPAFQEISFSGHRSSTRMKVFPTSPPVVTNQDSAVALAGVTLTVAAGKRVEKIENLADARARAGKQAGAGANTVLPILQEKSLVPTLASLPQAEGCLAGAAGKKVGEEWTAGGTARCRFNGWAEATGRRVLVIGIESSGTETGRGELYFDPLTRESRLQMTTNVTSKTDTATVVNSVHTLPL